MILKNYIIETFSPLDIGIENCIIHDIQLHGGAIIAVDNGQVDFQIKLYSK